MDADSLSLLARLIRTQRIGALGTLRDGSPLVSMIAWAPSDDFSSFIMHASGLAQHTQDMLADPRVSLMIAETDDAARNPQTLARVSIRGRSAVIASDRERLRARGIYLAKFPELEPLFDLGDFRLFSLGIDTARFVAGFGKTFNLTAQDFLRAAGTPSSPPSL
jgi:putative heme iron utilization protein